jgi:hypothetical protein
VAIVPSPSAVLASACVEAPVPPLLIARVPASVIIPEFVIGPPVSVNPLTVLEESTLVTVPPLLVEEIVKLG